MAVRNIRWHARASWETKLRPDLEPKLVRNPRGPGAMLVPTPMVVAEEIRRIRRGQIVTVASLRERLATRFHAQATCPLATGILLHIVAGATEDRLAAGRRPLAPYWRVVGESGRFNEKWPAGPEKQAEHLAAEGHEVARDPRTKKWSVVA